MRFLRNGDFAAAERWFTRAHQLDPERPEIAYALGRERMRQGRFAEAEELLRAAADDGTFRIGAGAERARCLGIHLGRPAEAIAVLEGCERACEGAERGLVLLVRAEIELERGDLAAAEAAATRIHAAGADEVAARGADQVLARIEVRRARALRAEGRDDSALFALARARRCDPEWAEPLVCSGEIFESREQPERALRDYLTALRIDPRSGAAAAVSRLLRRTRHPDAESALAAAAARAPDWLPTARAWAAHQIRSGDVRGAATTLEQCARARPDDPERWIELGRALGTTDAEAAERALRRALALAPSAGRARRLLAELLVRAGRYLEAVAVAEDSSALGLEGPRGRRLH